MAKKIKILVLPILIAVFLSAVSAVSVHSVTVTSKGVGEYKATAKLLLTKEIPTVGSIGGEWQVIGLARSKVSVDKSYFQQYQNNVVNTMAEKNGVLSVNKYTEYSRVILALTSIGSDVKNVAGYNLLSYLSDFDKVKRQGINGPIWALIALDSNNYEIPINQEQSNQTTREKLIEYILDKEIKTGGWALAGNVADPDVTAMAVTSLAKYYNSNTEVKSVVDRAVDCLAKLQNSSGEYSSFGVVNSESTSQVVVALCSLGINPDTDKRFIKNGKSPVDILLNYYVADGGFSHTKNSEYNQMATEQGFYALTAYYRFCNEENFLYDMTDVYEAQYTPTVTKSTTTTTSNSYVVTKTTEKNTTTYNSVTENKNEITDNHSTTTYPYVNNIQTSTKESFNSNQSISVETYEKILEENTKQENTTTSTSVNATTSVETTTSQSGIEKTSVPVTEVSKDYTDVFVNLVAIFVVGVLITILVTLILLIKKKSEKQL